MWIRWIEFDAKAQNDWIHTWKSTKKRIKNSCQWLLRTWIWQVIELLMPLWLCTPVCNKLSNLKDSMKRIISISTFSIFDSYPIGALKCKTRQIKHQHHLTTNQKKISILFFDSNQWCISLNYFHSLLGLQRTQKEFIHFSKTSLRLINLKFGHQQSPV